MQIFEEPTLDVHGPEEDGYVEARTAKTKTSSSLAKARRDIPLVADAKGVLGEKLAQEWLRARSRQKLVASPTSTIMPVPLEFGWSNVPMTTRNATVWLKELLMEAGVPEEELQNVGTHSLKATTLSWAAKAV